MPAARTLLPGGRFVRIRNVRRFAKEFLRSKRDCLSRVHIPTSHSGGTDMSTHSNQIQKTIVIKAPRKKVWQALSDSKEFGKWFGANIQDSFKPGAPARGKITTKGYEHVNMEMTIDRIVPEQVISWRWHPAATDPGHDYSQEPKMLVQFTLEDNKDGGTRLSMVETGFESLPPSRRDIALKMNEEGWSAQMKNIDRYVASSH